MLSDTYNNKNLSFLWTYTDVARMLTVATSLPQYWTHPDTSVSSIQTQKHVKQGLSLKMAAVVL